ncbi:hypothetical protein SC81_22905, partial [Vibrio vulnificus]
GQENAHLGDRVELRRPPDFKKKGVILVELLALAGQHLVLLSRLVQGIRKPVAVHQQRRLAHQLQFDRLHAFLQASRGPAAF